MWLMYALLSAVFAALMSVFVKMGVKGVDSHLVTAIRTSVVLIVAWGIVLLKGKFGAISGVGQKNLMFLIFAGIATGLSWICYDRALQIGELSKVGPVDKLSGVITLVLAFVILGETVTYKKVIGGILFAIGTVLLAL